MTVGGKLEAAISLGNNHAEEAVLLEEGPDFGWQVQAPVGDLPIIDHRAKLFHGAIDKGLLGFAQHWHLVIL